MLKFTQSVLVVITLCLLAACIDTSVSPSESSYSANQEPVAAPSTTASTTVPSQSVNKPTQSPSSTVYLYDVMVGGICKAMTIQTTGTLTSACQADATTSFLTWYNTCNVSAMHPAEYDNFTSQQLRSLLMTELAFTSDLVNSILSQAERCGSAMYIYSATSGLNFLYIERVGDGKGLLKSR